MKHSVKNILLLYATALLGLAVSCSPDNEKGDREKGVEGVIVTPAEASLEVGGSIQLTAEVMPEDAYDKSVVWNSSDPTVATVTQEGLVEAVALGSTIVSVTTNDGNFTALCKVSVGFIPVTGVSLDTDRITMYPGDTKQCTAEIIPSNATNRNVSWSSSDTQIASVSGNGIIKAIAEGEAIITVTTEDKGFTAECHITVTSFEIETVDIPAGTFTMGSPETEEGRYPDETQREITFSKGFRMSRYEITTTQFAHFLNASGIGEDGMGEVTYTENGQELTETKVFVLDSSKDAGEDGPYNHGVNWNAEQKAWVPVQGYEDCPIGHVSWFGAKAFADWYGGSLPTEAQWEYACRAGSTTAYYFGDDPANVLDYGWIFDAASWDGVSTPTIHPVGGKKPNDWGLYDMIGNVSEYCYDWFGEYEPEAQTDPTGPEQGSYGRYKVLRGSNIMSNYLYCRSAYRDGYSPEETGGGGVFGFRIVIND